MFRKRVKPASGRSAVDGATAATAAVEALGEHLGEPLGEHAGEAFGEGGEEGEAAAKATDCLKRRRRGSLGAALSSSAHHIGATTKRDEAACGAAIIARLSDDVLGGLKTGGASSASRDPAFDAVRTLELDTDRQSDARAILERNQRIHQELKEGTLEAGVYRGLGGYKQYAERKEGAISNSKYTGVLGPTRGMTNVRTTLRIEYIGTTGEGGICKDFKETGYCGFGDTCKFLHDRSDYKPSYQLEKEWDAKQKALQEQKRLQWEQQQAGGDADVSDDGGRHGGGGSEEEDHRVDALEAQARWTSREA